MAKITDEQRRKVVRDATQTGSADCPSCGLRGVVQAISAGDPEEGGGEVRCMACGEIFWED